jgi:hypothetical protein
MSNEKTMSSEKPKPLFALMGGLLYIGNGDPITSGSVFVYLFGSNSQREYDALKVRFGKPDVVGFFAQFESFFTYVLDEDPAAKMWTTKAAGAISPRPDPATDRSAFVNALYSAGSQPGTPFDAGFFLDRLVTTAVRGRAYAFLDRTYGTGTSETFERVLGAIVVDAHKTS